MASDSSTCSQVFSGTYVVLASLIVLLRFVGLAVELQNLCNVKVAANKTNWLALISHLSDLTLSDGMSSKGSKGHFVIWDGLEDCTKVKCLRVLTIFMWRWVTTCTTTLRFNASVVLRACIKWPETELAEKPTIQWPLEIDTIFSWYGFSLRMQLCYQPRPQTIPFATIQNWDFRSLVCSIENCSILF